MKVCNLIKKKVLWILTLVFCLCLSLLFTVQAAKLNLPAGLKIIEAEAFMGDSSIDEVVLPDGVEIIGSKAFANSSLKQIFLPSSVTYIAEDAFDRDIVIEATEGTIAYIWAKENGYIEDEETSLEFFGFRETLI